MAWLRPFLMLVGAVIIFCAMLADVVQQGLCRRDDPEDEPDPDSSQLPLG